jgi:tetratricopeptide (TPR) repeat protein
LALAAVEKIDEDSGKYDALAAISNAQAQAGEFEAAAATVDRIHAVYSWPPPALTLARLMAEAGRYDAAWAVAGKIANVNDRAQTLLAIGKAATKAGKPDLAQNAFAASLATAALLPNDSRFHNLMLDLAEVWAAVSPIAADRQITPVVAKAISAANAEADGEESIALLGAVHALCGQVDAARAILPSLHDPDLIARVRTRIAQAQARSGDAAGSRATLSAALADIDRVHSPYDRDEIRALVAANEDLSAAVALVNTMEDGSGRALRFGLLGYDISTLPNTESARDTIPAVLRAIEKIDDAQTRALMLWSVACFQAKAGDVASARDNVTAAMATIGRIESAFSRATAYGDFGFMLAHAGYRDESEAAFDDALMAADRIVDVAGLGDRELARMSIASNQVEAGAIAAARSTMERGLGHGWRNILLASIAGAEAKAEKVSDALTTADQIEDPRYRVEAFTRIANQLPQ